MDEWVEVNFDGLVGPTYTFSGLSFGNTASLKYKDEISSPKEAALQGLEKMQLLSSLGVKQAVLPPHERPHIPTLKQLGFSGSDSEILSQAKKHEFRLLLASSSASSMWAANAATMAPSIDTLDGKVHITPANLSHNFHRSIEAKVTERIMKSIFSDKNLFVVHPPLPKGSFLSDEGAANHTRVCQNFQEKGFHLFTYGKSVFHPKVVLPKKYPARQTIESSHAIARLNKLNSDLEMFVQQSPEAIDSGVFHCDVIATGNQNLFLYHEKAFVNTESFIEKLKSNISKTLGWELKTFEIKNKDLPIEEAVKSYFFNCQIITKNDGSMMMIAPLECRDKACLFPVEEIHFVNLKQSMKNGGGPACLRCRFVLNQREIDSIQPRVFLGNSLYERLKEWINRHYRDRLSPSDLADPNLLKESRQALDELTKLLNLGNVYDFQR